MGIIPPDTLLVQARSRLGEVAVRASADADAIDGMSAPLVAEPTTAEQVTELLAWASAEQLTVTIRGGGTKLEWGGVSTAVDVILSTARLNHVVEHRYGDLTATVDAGTTLDALNNTLATHRQWLPLDPPWSDRATIGGILATNDSGPHRHRHGAPRDLVIGITIARPDAALAKAGGIVVKNVAGYDLSRLMTGSVGSLGVIVDATFKLAPASAASRTVIVETDTIESLASGLVDIETSSLTPTVVEIGWPPARLLVRFDSVETAVAQQAAEAARLLGAAGRSARVETGRNAAEVWADYADWWDEPGSLVKLTTLPRKVVPTLSWLRQEGERRHVEVAAQGRGMGAVDLRLQGEVAAQGALLSALRQRFEPGQGAAVIRRGSPELRKTVDPWGPLGDGRPIMQAIKARFDPTGMLNPGRGPIIL